MRTIVCSRRLYISTESVNYRLILLSQQREILVGYFQLDMAFVYLLHILKIECKLCNWITKVSLNYLSNSHAVVYPLIIQQASGGRGIFEAVYFKEP